MVWSLPFLRSSLGPLFWVERRGSSLPLHLLHLGLIRAEGMPSPTRPPQTSASGSGHGPPASGPPGPQPGTSHSFLRQGKALARTKRTGAATPPLPGPPDYFCWMVNWRNRGGLLSYKPLENLRTLQMLWSLHQCLVRERWRPTGWGTATRPGPSCHLQHISPSAQARHSRWKKKGKPNVGRGNISILERRNAVLPTDFSCHRSAKLHET